MDEEFGECYPLHLGVTEAGDGEDGRIKSAVGIASLLEDGIGDTIRVSLTEDPEFEIPVCRDIVQKYNLPSQEKITIPATDKLSYDPFSYNRRKSFAVQNIGAGQVPVVIADLSKEKTITPKTLESIGYHYDEATDKWNIGDQAADFMFTGSIIPDFALPGTLRVIVYPSAIQPDTDLQKVLPIFDIEEYAATENKSAQLNFVMMDCYSDDATNANLALLENIDNSMVLCLSSTNKNVVQSIRRMFVELKSRNIDNPVVIIADSAGHTPDEHLVKLATDTGALLLDGLGDGICLGYAASATMDDVQAKGRTYLPVKDLNQFTNNTAFSILQATRVRISKTEYISCPSCGRTLFDLQETTAKIREATHHLKGVKIAIMGCIVNGPGEMADADFGYVGSGVGKISLYKNKDVVKKNVPSEIAVDELIQLLKDNGAWVER